MRVRWTQPALDDFKAISHRIEQEGNLTTANRVCRSIYDALQTLRRYPNSGKPGAAGDAVEILHIWHGAQDWR